MKRRVIAFIPVRGGSKSIPLKNIKEFCDKPLVYWNVRALQDAPSVDGIIVATDSPEIKRCVESFNFTKVEIYDRDPENAADTSSTESVMLEYLSKHAYDDGDLFMLVQATSPLTVTGDFEGALSMYDKTGADSLLTGVRTKNFFWSEEGIPVNYDYMHRPRRQDFKGMIRENGAFYINTVGNIRRHKNRLCGRIAVYEMAEYTSFEIDEPDDWIICESLMRRHILKDDNQKHTVKLFLTDVDGVLTDAGMYYSENGDELKKFNTLDGMGIGLLRRAGIKTGIITAENTKIVERRAEKLKIDFLCQGVYDKLSCALEICGKEGISLSEVAYIGDDINDKELLSRAGWAAAPANAVAQIKAIPSITLLNRQGGCGAVREFAEMILESQKKNS